jgi:hypothetical protein
MIRKRGRGMNTGSNGPRPGAPDGKGTHVCHWWLVSPYWRGDR